MAMAENPYLSARKPVRPPPLPPGEHRPWNGWWTLLWGVGLLLIWQLVVTVGFLIAGFEAGYFNDSDSLEEGLSALSFDGDVVGLTSFAAVFFVCPLCWFFGQLCPGFSGWDYLGNEPVRWWTWPLWGAATVACSVVFGWVAPFFGVHDPDESMVRMGRSTDVPLLLFLGVAIGAPLVEEFIFRGVLWRGWRDSRMGMVGTLTMTSLLWASLHVQYPAVIICYIFVLGLLLGWAREKTGSLWVPVWMHAVNNGLATLYMLQL